MDPVEALRAKMVLACGMLQKQRVLVGHDQPNAHLDSSISEVVE